MKANPFSLFGAASIALLSACGGGSGDDSASAPPDDSTDSLPDDTVEVSVDATPIRVFADGSGIAKARITTGEGTTTGFLMGPDLALLIDILNDTKDLTLFDFNALPVVDFGPNTTIRQGAISENGVVINGTVAVTEDEDAALAYFEDPTFGDSILVSEGVIASGIPSTGSASYSGTFGMMHFADDSPEIGTFTATANFQASTVEFDGVTATFGARGPSVISGGSFASSSITIEDLFLNVVTDGSLQGDFHGAGANSISGVIYSNDSFGDYRGGFVGSR